MAFSLNHVHLKTPDPRATADWYVQNLGATVTAEAPNGGFRLDLHGLPLNVTDHIATQTHPQNYGFEHIAIDTTDIDGTIADLKKRRRHSAGRDHRGRRAPGHVLRRSPGHHPGSTRGNRRLEAVCSAP